MRQLIFDVLRLLLTTGKTPADSAEVHRLDALHEQLDRAVQQYTTVNTIFWAVFSIFAAGHAVLVDALAQSPSTNGYISAGTGLALSAVGLLAAVAWFLLLLRVVGYLLLNEQLVTTLEVALKNQPQYQLLTHPSWRKFGPPAKVVMLICAGASVIGWLLALINFAIRYWCNR